MRKEAIFETDKDIHSIRACLKIRQDKLYIRDLDIFFVLKKGDMCTYVRTLFPSHSLISICL